MESQNQVQKFGSTKVFKPEGQAKQPDNPTLTWYWRLPEWNQTHEREAKLKALRKEKAANKVIPELTYAQKIEAEDAPARAWKGWQIGNAPDETFIHLNTRKLRRRKREIAEDYKTMVAIAKERKVGTEMALAELADESGPTMKAIRQRATDSALRQIASKRPPKNRVIAREEVLRISAPEGESSTNV